jgi:hypothetical protein
LIDLKVGKFGYADAGQMYLYLNYAREHWMKPEENSPVGLILCTEKGVAEVHSALDNLPNKVRAAEYRTVLLDEKLIRRIGMILGSASGFRSGKLDLSFEEIPHSQNRIVA